MTDLMTEAVEWNTQCPGIPERYVVPILLSSLSTTELCLMFYIEQIDHEVIYRSRNCKKQVSCDKENNICANCQKLFDNLSHFHHLYLEISCAQYNLKTGINKDEEKKHVETHETLLSNSDLTVCVSNKASRKNEMFYFIF